MSNIGFHFGVPSLSTGHGDHVKALDEKGIPAVVMSTGGGGYGDIYTRWENGSTVPHIAVLRYMPPGGHPDGRQDVPRYDLDPEAAAARFWAWTRYEIGNDAKKYKDRVWIKIGNEPDKTRIAWLTQFYMEIFEKMQQDEWGPFKLVAYNFSTGEPEPEQWQHARPYLELCAAYPDQTAIGLHEYSLTNALLLEPTQPEKWHGGRFHHLLDYCQAENIPAPRIFMHEVGWRQDQAPAGIDTKMQHIAAYHDFIRQKAAEHNTTIYGGLWTLQTAGSYGEIYKTISPLIPHMTDFAKQQGAQPPPSATPPPIDPPPVEPPPAETYTIRRQTAVNLTRLKANNGGYLSTKNVTLTPVDSYGQPTADPLTVQFSPDTIRIRISADYTETIENPFSQPTPPPVEPPPVEPPAQLRPGDLAIDISNHNGAVDWDAIERSAVKYVIIRCSSGIGSYTTDPDGHDLQLKRNAREATERGIPFSLYHYFNPAHNPTEQGKIAAEAINAMIYLETPPNPPIMPDGRPAPAIYIDVERLTTNTDQVKLCDDAIEKFTVATISPNGIYTQPRVWNAISEGWINWYYDRHFWTAEYWTNGTDPQPGSEPAPINGVNRVYLWQYSSEGSPTLPELGDKLDVSRVLNPMITPRPDKLNMIKYIFGDGRPYMVKNSDGGSERFQMQSSGTGYLYQTKNQQWRRFYVGDNAIHTDIDTSPGAGRFYVVSGGDDDGAPWIPAEMAIGESFTRSAHVQFYDKSTCTPDPANSGPVTDTMRLNAHHETLTMHTGRIMHDVIELEWINGGEVYYYAANYGLIGWSRLHQDPNSPQWTAISSDDPGAYNNEREIISCLE